MLKLYHNVNSVCAQKVRIALKEKGLEAEDHLMTLRGDQNGDALMQHRKLLAWMADSLKAGQFLADERFSNADCAVIPYILRLELLKLDGMWAPYPAIAEWWARMRMLPSVRAAIFDRMSETDWAPFKKLEPDPWPKVESLLKAA
jgi:glutathione S-transferase